MKETKCSTIGELIEELKKYPPESEWFGGEGATISWVQVLTDKKGISTSDGDVIIYDGDYAQ